MRGALAVRLARAAVALGVWLAVSAPATAFEYFDGRLQVHGFYEMIVRSLWSEFEGGNDWDLAQWQHVLNLEIEADIAPDGWGPFDLVSGFARVEVRYDCVWRRGCWTLPSANMYGDRANRIAKRVSGGRRSGYSGNAFTGDVRRYVGVKEREFLDGTLFRTRPNDSRTPADFPFIPGFSAFAGIEGPDGVLGTPDDPAPFVFSEFFGTDECVYGVQKVSGNTAGRGGTRVLPWDPGCQIESNGALRNKPNPFKGEDINPTLKQAIRIQVDEDTGMRFTPTDEFGARLKPVGKFALPYRPAPRFVNAAQRGLEAPPGEAQGIFYPSLPLAERLKEGGFDNFDQNFNQDELAWNHGASQEFWRELKELYVDMEFFDARLWVRLGKQSIVWGKTELFRTTDQFNPQDLGLASLPSLEESRIALWAIRGVWSFYEVGPLSDVRLELAANFDTLEPTDLGRCGEPFSPLPVCTKTFGLQAHSLTGAGLAGEIRPGKPWNDLDGWEVGARLEFRWDRFSVAITDFYGFGDGLVADRLFNYSRNVDPVSGRPRELSELTNQGRCEDGRQEACLTPREALTKHSVNQQLFAMICASSIGFSDLDANACGQSVFNSRNGTVRDTTDPLFSVAPLVMVAFTTMLSGQATAGRIGIGFNGGINNAGTLLATLGEFTDSDPVAFNRMNAQLRRFPDVQVQGPAPTATMFTPLVPLVFNGTTNATGAVVSRGFEGGPANVPAPLVACCGPNITTWTPIALSPFLTNEQEALLGCGPFYGTNCDLDGVDLLNAEASALLQSFPLIEGTFGVGIDWDTTNRGLAQPGTVRFKGGAVCTRFERGRQFILPGCRGRGDQGYSVRQDGTTFGPAALGDPPGPQGLTFGAYETVAGPRSQRVHPFTGQPFANEMAILSWNLLMVLVTQSDTWDPRKPFARGTCSFAQPQRCSAVQALFTIGGVGRPDIFAGGNGEFGRRDFLWASGAELVIRYQKRNVLGFSLDFAEDRTKSNWSMEFTWFNDIPLGSVDSFNGLTEVDTFNLTISADRPTFVNFLNANRTFFINTQWFFQYVNGHTAGITSNGPWNILFTVAVQTGYFQDRLLPSLVTVYDFGSNSGALLPQITYRYNEAFSAVFGVGVFWGREETRALAARGALLGNAIGPTRNTTFVENGLSAIRERDEIFMRLRYTF